MFYWVKLDHVKKLERQAKNKQMFKHLRNLQNKFLKLKLILQSTNSLINLLK